MIKSVIMAVALVTTTSAAFAGSIPHWKNHECKYDLRGLKDPVVFVINQYGNVEHKKSWGKRFGVPYVNTDGTCGLINPETNKKDTPFGYRKGFLKAL